MLDSLSDEQRLGRAGLIAGDESAIIGLSEEAAAQLDRIEYFLRQTVFAEPRVANRRQMLEVISGACLQLLYEGDQDVLQRFVDGRARLERWNSDRHARAQELLRDDVHRAQLAVDVLANMSDQEIFDFAGIQSL